MARYWTIAPGVNQRAATKWYVIRPSPRRSSGPRGSAPMHPAIAPAYRPGNPRIPCLQTWRGPTRARLPRSARSRMSDLAPGDALGPHATPGSCRPPINPQPITRRDDGEDHRHGACPELRVGERHDRRIEVVVQENEPEDDDQQQHRQRHDDPIPEDGVAGLGADELPEPVDDGEGERHAHEEDDEGEEGGGHRLRRACSARL